MHAVTYSQCRFEECLWFRQSCMQFASTTSVIRKESFVTQWRQMAITCIKKTNLPCGSANGHNDSQISKFIVAIIGCQKTNFPCCTTSQKALCCVQIGSFTFSIYGTKQDVNLRRVNKYNLHKIWEHLATSFFAGLLQGWTLNFGSTPHSGEWHFFYILHLDQFHSPKSLPPPISPTILVMFYFYHLMTI